MNCIEDEAFRRVPNSRKAEDWIELGKPAMLTFPFTGTLGCDFAE